MLLLLLLSLTGCGPKLPQLQRLAPLPEGSICRLAVLPFLSESDFPLADTIAYKVFMAELNASGNYVISQEGDVRKIYKQLRIYPEEQPTLEEMQILADRLGVQLLILGNVIEMREAPGERGTVNPVLALTLKIYDARTGKTLWNTYHRREGKNYQKVMHFGQVNTVTGLCRRASQEILDLWFKEGFSRCSE